MSTPADNPMPPSPPPEADELLSAYLDGELAGDELAAVERRLVDDPAARATLDAMRGLSSTLKSLPKATADSGFADAVQSHIEVEAATAGDRAAIIDRHPCEQAGDPWTPWSGSPRRWVYAGMAVAAALLVMVLSPESPDNAPSDLAKLDPAAVDPPPALALEMEAAPAAATLPAAETMPAADTMDDAIAEAAPAAPPPPLQLGRAAVTDGRIESATTSDAAATTDSTPRSAAARPAPAPATGEPAAAARQVKESADPPVIVVRVQLRPEAYREQLVNRVLATQGIAVESEPRRQSLARAEAAEPAEQDEADAVATRGSILSNTLTALRTNELGRRAAELAASSSPAADVLVLDAPASQFAAALDVLSNDFANCNSLLVCPSDESDAVSPEKLSRAGSEPLGVAAPQDEADWRGYNRSGGRPRRRAAPLRQQKLAPQSPAQAYQLAADELATLQATPPAKASTNSDADGFATRSRGARSFSFAAPQQLPPPTDSSLRVQALVIVEPDPAPQAETESAE